MTDYVCANCGASGVKLWRLYASSWINLLCASCAAKDQGEDITSIGMDGLHMSSFSGQPTDQIGSYIPAVPDENGNYWGYTSVPEAAAAWWRQLPNEGKR